MNLSLLEGQRIRWSWETTDEMEFNVHTHAGGQVDYIERQTSTSGSGEYKAATSGIHSLMWKNPKENPLEVTITIRGEFTIHSYHPE